MADQHHRVAHHVVQHASALQVTAPKPRLVRTAMFLGSPRQIRPAREGYASRPNDVAPGRNRRREELIFKISMANAGFFNQLEDPLRLSDIPCKRFLAGNTFERSAALFNRRNDLIDILDACVIWTA